MSEQFDQDQTASEAQSHEQRAGHERRAAGERRQKPREQGGYTGPERRQSAVDRRTGLERRRGAGIRRSDERKSAEEGEMNVEQFEFIMAIETYKKVNKKMYPTWTEILEVLRQLGYRKVEPRAIKLDVPEAPLCTVQPIEKAA
jgi:hypothetical protein